MLPSISSGNPRSLAIDRALQQLPKVITHIIDQYDGWEQELIEFVQSYDVVALVRLACRIDLYYCGGGVGVEHLDRKQRLINMEKELRQNKLTGLAIFSDTRSFCRDDANAFVKLRQAWRAPDCPPSVIINMMHRCNHMGDCEEDHVPGNNNKKSSGLDKLRVLMDAPPVLSNENFSDWNFKYVQEFFKDATLTHMDFVQCTFWHVDFSGVDFSGSTFTDVTFRRCTFSASVFRNTRLIRTTFINSELVNMMYVDFNDTLFCDVKFSCFRDDVGDPRPFWIALKPQDWHMRKLLLADMGMRLIRRNLPWEFRYTSVAAQPKPDNNSNSCLLM